MRVSAWKGGTYGIYVGKANAAKYFKKKWNNVLVVIDGSFYCFILSRTFWKKCPEIRGRPIGDWLSRNGNASWQKGHPPKFDLRPLGGRRFELV